MLSWIIFIPLLTALAVLCVPAHLKHVFKGLAVAGSTLTLLLASFLTWDYLHGDDDPGLIGAMIDQYNSALDTAEDGGLHGVSPATAGAIADAVGKLDPKTGIAQGEGRQLGASADDLAAWAALDKRDPTNQNRVYAYERAREAYLILVDPLRAGDPKHAHRASVREEAAHNKYVDNTPWIPLFNINYLVGVDGLSLPLIWLTTLLGPLCLIYSWNIEKGAKAYFALFLLLECGLIGVFCALDFFLFYVFWEIVLLPMYFLIGIWGGPRRLYAAIKFFIYTLVGSVLMLIAMLALYFVADDLSTFNMFTLHALGRGFSNDFQWWIFLGLFIGFAIKVPIFPFHTWLPDAHVEAPTAVSVVLAGVLLKMGGYGFFRLSYPLAADVFAQSFTTLIAWLGLINLVYGALVAMAQTDFKKMVAYSSVSHMGYVMLGLAAFSHASVQGAALQMLNHGVSSAMMFLIVGVIYERAHHRDLNRFGGIALKMPIYASLAMIGFFASLGLPGLNGFISEVMVFLGMWDGDSFMRSVQLAGETTTTNYTWMIFACLPGIVLTAGYILWAIQRVFMGPLREESAGFADINWREGIALAPLGFLCVLLGVFPMIAMAYISPTLTTMVEAVRPALPVIGP